MVWNSGSWLVVRSSRRSVTICSSGTPWWVNASSVVRRVRPSSSAKVGSAPRSMRSGSVLTNMPETRSSVPDSRASRTAKVESSAMNGVTRCLRAVRAIACHSSWPSSRSYEAPSNPWTAGLV